MSLSSSQPPAPHRARRTIATYSNYREAERGVDWLSDQGFAVEHVAIVGTGLRTVEQVAGRVTTTRAALAGAAQGALVGLLFALFFGLFFTGPAFFGLLVYAVVAGVIFGAFAHGALGGAATSLRSRGPKPSATSCRWTRGSPTRPSGYSPPSRTDTTATRRGRRLRRAQIDRSRAPQRLTAWLRRDSARRPLAPQRPGRHAIA